MASRQSLREGGDELFIHVWGPSSSGAISNSCLISDIAFTPLVGLHAVVDTRNAGSCSSSGEPGTDDSDAWRRDLLPARDFPLNKRKLG
jgi:hypothetical protein